MFAIKFLKHYNFVDWDQSEVAIATESLCTMWVFILYSCDLDSYFTESELLAIDSDFEYFYSGNHILL